MAARVSPWLFCVVLSCWSFSAVYATSDQCYQLISANGGRSASAFSCPSSVSAKACFLLCGLCNTPHLSFVFDQAEMAYCSSPPANDDTIYNLATSALLNVSATHGYFWLNGPEEPEQNATECFKHLVQYMPLRDVQLLLVNSFQFLDFLIEHVRYSLQTWPFASKLGVPWEVFKENVVPYAILDEKRDLFWRWRRRFFQLLTPVVWGSSPATITQAMHALATAIPAAQLEGVLSMETASGMSLQPGPPISWHSEVSPAFLSPQQVVEHGGSCTGTAIAMVAASRAVGIPARIAGCSESIVRGDDHHWEEFYDPTDAGPFGDYWHTKEGVSKGNAGGPWDAPSEPMKWCLQGVVPGSSLDSLWAGSWSSATFLPTLWANSSWTQRWSHIGGLNRCGAYCQVWGCGTNNTRHYSQAQCGPK